MTESIEFAKLSGSGNDFICLDNRQGRFDDILGSAVRAGRFAETLCRRGLGVGADGIVFACAPGLDGVADVAATFLEPDGSEAYLCGNGTACFIHWASMHGIVPDGEVQILTTAGIVRGQDIDDGYVRVCIPLPEDVRTDLRVRVDSETLTCDYALVGVEHLVTYVDDIARVDVAHLGPALRNHERFGQPKGVNVNFVQVLDVGEIAVRTYEYGVEAETLACGTGSAAAAMLTARRFGWASKYLTRGMPTLVRVPSGDTLRVHFDTGPDGAFIDPCIETLVRCTYTGSLCPDLAALAIRDDCRPRGLCRCHR